MLVRENDLQRKTWTQATQYETGRRPEPSNFGSLYSGACVLARFGPAGEKAAKVATLLRILNNSSFPKTYSEISWYTVAQEACGD